VLACDHDKVYRIATKGKTGKPCRLFECADCGLHFSATTGTLFHDSHLPLQKWFMVMALMGEAKKGISANQVARHIGVQYKTAWHLCHRIRKAMEELNQPPMGSKGQIVEIDETRLGGRKLRKGHKAGVDNKITVLGIAERNGRVHMQKISNVKAARCRPLGRDIMIHGIQKGLGWLGPLHRAADWTDGCIAVTDAEIEEIYSAVPDGTPVETPR
jgi:transposase-like protein